MPITPLHLGPGLIFKALAGAKLSLMMFSFAQIAMDTEVILRLVSGSARLHGFTHTILGATAVLLICVPLGRPLCEGVLRWWNIQLNERQAKWLGVDAAISWRAAWIGGASGVYSHLMLDAVMHADAQPWMPFSRANNLLDLVSIEVLNGLCLIAVFIGVILTAGVRIISTRRWENFSANGSRFHPGSPANPADHPPELCRRDTGT